MSHGCRQDENTDTTGSRACTGEGSFQTQGDRLEEQRDFGSRAHKLAFATFGVVKGIFERSGDQAHLDLGRIHFPEAARPGHARHGICHRRLASHLPRRRICRLVPWCRTTSCLDEHTERHHACCIPISAKTFQHASAVRARRRSLSGSTCGGRLGGARC